FGKTRGEVEDSEPNPVLGLARALNEQATQSEGFCAILSCAQDQRSWEHPKLKHGVFTYYLIQGFQGEAADKDGVIKDHNLHEFVHNHTKSWVSENIPGHKQTPVSFATRGESIVLGLVNHNNKFSPDYSSYSYDEKISEYRKAIDREIYQQTSLSKEIEEIQVLEDIINQRSRKILQTLNQELGLISRDIDLAEQSITQRCKEQLIFYKQKAIEFLEQQYPLTKDALQKLQELQQRRDINSKIATAVREKMTRIYENKLQQYREDLQIDIDQQGLPSNEAFQDLQELPKKLELNTPRVDLIEAAIDYEDVFTQVIQRRDVRKNKVKKKGGVITISLLVTLGAFTSATVIGSSYIEPLCRMLGNCASYKHKLEQAQAKLSESLNLEPQDWNNLESQRIQIEKAIEPLSGIRGNAQVYRQVEELQQLAQNEIKLRQARIFIEEANKAHLDALQTIERIKNSKSKINLIKHCVFFKKAKISWSKAMQKEQEAINKVEELAQFEGLVQYSQTLNKQNLANYQKLKDDAARQYSNIPQCTLGGAPKWNQPIQSPD
ncbi:MAG: hypothetical protein F6K41_27115, partial [Symploca sp. SIO3E6]|nr:hypothetical protein [Caldora sp. SIO3E6]